MADVRYADVDKKQFFSNIKPLYLLYGKELLLKNEVIKKISNHILGENISNFNFETFFCNDVKIDSVISILNTSPFLSDKKIVVLKEIENLNTDDLKKLIKYFENPHPASHLIMVVDAQDKKLNLPSAIEELIRKNGTIINCSLTENELQMWIKNKIEFSGKVIDNEALDYLIAVTAGDLYQLNSEIEKLILYSESSTNITIDDIQAIVVPKVESQIWDLTDAISKRAKEKAISYINYLLNIKESEEKILGAIRKHFRLLWQAKVLIEKGVLGRGSYSVLSRNTGVEDILPQDPKENILKQNQWSIAKYVNQSNSFSEEKIILSLNDIYNCELEIKGIKDEKSPRLALEILMIKLCEK